MHTADGTGLSFGSVLHIIDAATVLPQCFVDQQLTSSMGRLLYHGSHERYSPLVFIKSSLACYSGHDGGATIIGKSSLLCAL